MRFLIVCLLITLLSMPCMNVRATNRNFSIDWENDRFLKDGKPFRFIAGSFHYFRAHPESWQRKLRTLRTAGLNAVTTYVEWSLHNPKDDVYVWTGIADLERFIKLAVAEDLLVILRPGPYICAERDFGGFPFWLLSKYPHIKLRTADMDYLFEVRKWYSTLMARIAPYLYGNGGPIIMVQVENEYGSYSACDEKYRTWLRDETLAHVKNHAALFTNDGPSVLRCGHIDGVLITMDFGAVNNVTSVWEKKTKVQPHGPLVNAEYYPGWLTHWSEPMARVETKKIIRTLVNMLDDGASVNFYMFYGGTNFGFTAGANHGGPGDFLPDITSYDYDAPMDEAGDPTPKYHELREIIGRYLPLPNTPIPLPLPKKKYGSVQLQRYCSLLSPLGRKYLATGVVIANQPKTFEELEQFSGFVLYETILPAIRHDPTVLYAPGVRDRAYVYIDNTFIGIMSRETPVFELPVMASSSSATLQMLVENQGRINYGNLVDFKGLISKVMLGTNTLTHWNMTKFPLESYNDIQLMKQSVDAFESGTTGAQDCHLQTDTLSLKGPTVFYGTLNIAENNLGDTYLDTTGWGKGLVYVNGENLGRYWPVTGPQVTLYVPREVLIAGENKIVLIEYQQPEAAYEIKFTDTPNLDG